MTIPDFLFSYELHVNCEPPSNFFFLFFSIQGKDSCGGDSGGPLVFREFAGEPWYEVGLVSYGTRTCGIGIPAVYTKVASFLNWIEEKMQP